MTSQWAVQKAEVMPCLNSEILLPNNRPFRNSKPLWLISAERNRATEGFPLHLAPGNARIVGVGAHDVLPMKAVVFVSEENQISVAIESDVFDLGREVLIRIWTLDSPGINRTARFEQGNDGIVATAQFGLWDGLPLSGVTLFPLSKAGEEC